MAGADRFRSGGHGLVGGQGGGGGPGPGRGRPAGSGRGRGGRRAWRGLRPDGRSHARRGLERN
ncbi:hypothetical protein CSW58_10060 [Caulobacter sp. B11]|nr:hypothetical protein CSW58_10060 [Caulobacter sp. B11]